LAPVANIEVLAEFHARRADSTVEASIRGIKRG
jgi:hypothetical protein